MSISIDSARCVRCGACVAVCPGNLLKVLAGGGTAFSKRPQECWGCTACLKACPADAIAYFLGADIGGRGTRLSCRATATQTDWTFAAADGTLTHIVVDKTQSNRY